MWEYPDICAVNMLQAVLKPSPSLVNGNLCTVGAGLAYVHTRSVCQLQSSWSWQITQEACNW